MDIALYPSKYVVKNHMDVVIFSQEISKKIKCLERANDNNNNFTPLHYVHFWFQKRPF